MFPEYKYSYSGHIIFNQYAILKSVPSAVGIYYCGTLNAVGKLVPFYIGRSSQLQKRLQEHVSDKKWPDVTHLGYRLCLSEAKSIELEATEIALWQPKYNMVGKTSGLIGYLNQQL